MEELANENALVFVHPTPLRGMHHPRFRPALADFLLDTTRAAIGLVASGTVSAFPVFGPSFPTAEGSCRTPPTASPGSARCSTTVTTTVEPRCRQTRSWPGCARSLRPRTVVERPPALRSAQFHRHTPPAVRERLAVCRGARRRALPRGVRGLWRPHDGAADAHRQRDCCRPRPRVVRPRTTTPKERSMSELREVTPTDACTSSRAPAGGSGMPSARRSSASDTARSFLPPERTERCGRGPSSVAAETGPKPTGRPAAILGEDPLDRPRKSDAWTETDTVPRARLDREQHDRRRRHLLVARSPARRYCSEQARQIRST